LFDRTGGAGSEARSIQGLPCWERLLASRFRSQEELIRIKWKTLNDARQPLRVKPLLETSIEPSEHFFVNAPYVSKSAPSDDVAILTCTFEFRDEFLHSSPRSRYLSRRCRLQVSAVCFWRFLVPSPMVSRKCYHRLLLYLISTLVGLLSFRVPLLRLPRT
jgi:hypothetical protein